MGKGKRNEDESCSDEAPCRSDERTDIRELTLHPASSESIAGTGCHAGGDGPTLSIGREVELSPNKDDGSDNAEAEPDELWDPETFLKPNRGNDSTKEWHTGVHERGEACTESEAGIGEEEEGKGGTEKATDKEGKPVLFEGLAGFFLQEDEGEGEPSNTHTQGHERKGPKFWSGNPHKEKRGSPKCGKQNENEEIADAHAA